MSPTLAIVLIVAAALILVPLGVAYDLWTRARNRGRLPSWPAMVTIVLALGSSLHNLSFVYQGTMAGGDGLSGLNVVLALWSTMGLLVLWGTLMTRRVRLYRAMDAGIVPAISPIRHAQPPSVTGLPAFASPAQRVGSGGTSDNADRQYPPAIVRLAYRDDPSPGVPCAAPLSMMQMPPTLRDIVRAAPASPAPVSVQVSQAAQPPVTQHDVARSPLPRDVLAVRTPVARFASGPMAAALRGSDLTLRADAVPRFRTTRVLSPPVVC